MPCSEVTPILTFSPTSDALIGMLEVCISSKTDLITGIFGGVETVDVMVIVDSVKIGEERGAKSMGSEV
mgnify:CR=1 FL=1